MLLGIGLTTARRSSRPARALAIMGLTICATAVLVTSSAAGAPATTLTTCDEASLKAAVAHGGTVQYGLDCTVTLTSPVIVSSGLTVDVEAGGFRVILSGGHTSRQFVVTGGDLTVGGRGAAIGASGRGGGDTRRASGPLAQKEPMERVDLPATPVGAAEWPVRAPAGAVAQGGSILIDSGAVTLNRRDVVQ